MLKSCLLLFCGLCLSAAEPLMLVLNPSHPFGKVDRGMVVDLLQGNTTLIGGKRITLVLTKPSSKSLPAVTYGLLRQAPLAYLSAVRLAKTQGLALDPQFLDSPGAVEEFIAKNPQAMGVLVQSEAGGKGTLLIPLD